MYIYEEGIPAEILEAEGVDPKQDGMFIAFSGRLTPLLLVY